MEITLQKILQSTSINLWNFFQADKNLATVHNLTQPPKHNFSKQQQRTL